MQRIYNFFNLNKNEAELEEVLISNPTQVKGKEPHSFLYFEIKECLLILKETIQPTQTHQQYQKNIVLFESALSLTSLSMFFLLPGINLKFILDYHSHALSMLENIFKPFFNKKENGLLNEISDLQYESDYLSSFYGRGFEHPCYKNLLNDIDPFYDEEDAWGYKWLKKKWWNCIDDKLNNYTAPTIYAEFTVDYCLMEQQFHHRDQECKNV
jgi:hypothetical protein